MDKGHDKGHKGQMSDREVMRLALEALEAKGDAWIVLERKAREALRQALEQEPCDTSDMAHRPNGLSMGQEPVTWRNAAIRLGEDLYSVGPNGYYDMTASQWLDWALSVVNTAPPKREWVWLTDEEIVVCGGMDGADNWVFEFANALQIKLREKNHG